ncbi:excinuclease ABC subunit UvrA [Burkholderiales bacterium]|nr:excinuclease ABC subunit UvrA [Burkholderiales bacterium]
MNAVKTSRSTVGTMTELSDYLKLLFAKYAKLHCRSCAKLVEIDDLDTVVSKLAEHQLGRVVVKAPVVVPENFTATEIEGYLTAQGYDRFLRVSEQTHVVIDRFDLNNVEETRLTEAFEAAFRVGQGKCSVAPYSQGEVGNDVLNFSNRFHCASCNIDYSPPSAGLFSFNSPVGACATCRGFGRVIGVDMDAVLSSSKLSLKDGVIRPWQTDSYSGCQNELLESARSRNIPIDVAWCDMNHADKQWVLEGDPEWVSWRKSWPKYWYGVRRYFGWLETKAYKMHIRVLLAKYRSYSVCPDCLGSRLKPSALLWRIGSKKPELDFTDTPFQHPGIDLDLDKLRAIAGMSIHQLNTLPIWDLKKFINQEKVRWQEMSKDDSSQLVLDQILSRLDFLEEVGLGYLSLDRQSRTLSGGETQRLNLATALGASLTQTLFLLDEPSIGLHPRDIEKVISVIDRLKGNGNTIVVVEHDPQIIRAASFLLDIGPQAGERGGHIEYFGKTSNLRVDSGLTAEYLLGKRSVIDSILTKPVEPRKTQWLSVLGACRNNLKCIDVDIPLGHLVSITGVSGSGKSTLVEDTLFKEISRYIEGKGLSNDGVKGFKNLDVISRVVMLDQRPIGKSSRSNPVSYVSALDGIRDLFAASPGALKAGFDKSYFSFNSGKGRCQSCAGSGFELVEMQFLSDVYLRCNQCDGKRYGQDVLRIQVDLPDIGLVNIDDVLNLTISDAMIAFKNAAKICRKLQCLVDVGLGYLRLGQPVPTLSGGEAQRLKLASYLSEASTRSVNQTLFLLDEPTTGLHFHDVRKLLIALRALVNLGASIVVVEHNLDLIAASDWIIDLGPEGGDGGGEVVCFGSPERIYNEASSLTGVELTRVKNQLVGINTRDVPRLDSQVGQSVPNSISIRNARENNLQDISVNIPHEKLTVITGLSGSGKSSLAFDIIYGEGQRRYLESLNAYARQFIHVGKKPDVDAVYGIPPAVAIEQRTSRGGIKSTVGTVTETYHYLRLLMSKLGTQFCPECRVKIEPQNLSSIVERLLNDYSGKHIGFLAPLVRARKGVYKELAETYRKKGFTHLLVDSTFVKTDAFPNLDRYVEHTIELPLASMTVSELQRAQIINVVLDALQYGSGFFHVISDIDDLLKGGTFEQESFSSKRACPSCQQSFDELDPRLFSFNSKYGWCHACQGMGQVLEGNIQSIKSLKDEIEVETERAKNTQDSDSAVCGMCDGVRLNNQAKSVVWKDLTMSDLVSTPVGSLYRILSEIHLTERERLIAKDLLKEVLSRLRFLTDVGLKYLTLNRSAPTLSGGESQRMRLSAQLGSNLRGAVYVLDEPTIGLHSRDNDVLLKALKHLQNNGNTLVVVEHDEDTIKQADFVIDLGPGAGSEGGNIISSGSPEEIMCDDASITGHYLTSKRRFFHTGAKQIKKSTDFIRIESATRNNLKSINAEIPIGYLTAVTGVSGSGKSSLIRGTLRTNMDKFVSRSKSETQIQGFVDCASITGIQCFSRVIEVDQAPIGKTSRSCPATYTGIWDEVRKLFASTTESRIRGFGPARFSFNTKGGRCEGCEGQGIQKLEMNFLPDVRTVCEVCNGDRFSKDTLQIRYNNHSIADVLKLSIKDALELFSAHPRINKKLNLLNELGLGYLTLGQHSSTLSGGEAQRIKLVSELSKFRVDNEDHFSRSGQNQTLFVLDEPTVGLHMADVEKLIEALKRLAGAGGTVVVIEHNLDVISSADWVIDLGPEGGDAGGYVLFQGKPKELAKQTTSATGEALKGLLT